MAEENLAVLANRFGINTMIDLLNQDALSEIDILAFQKDLYYDQMMLDKIKLTQDNYIFLQYAKTYSIPKGHAKWTIRRPFPLTEHTIPLLEGIPPQSDKTKRERIEGTFHQYGRYMEFSDVVDWTLLDPVIMEYAEEYGDVATRTMHRLARKELLNTTMKVYAGNRESMGSLDFEEDSRVGLADFRLVALKLSRLAVKPIDGVFHVITSEEHFWDLMKDPLILEYIGTNNGLGHYADGTLPTLFSIKFIKTQFDDYSYGYELANSGEFVETVGVTVTEECRFYSTNALGEYVYMNQGVASKKSYVADEYKGTSGYTDYTYRYEELGDQVNVDNMQAQSDSINRLSDGSWIPIRNVWTPALASITLGADVAEPGADVATKTQWLNDLYYTYDLTAGTIEKEFTLWLKYLNTADEAAYYDLGTCGAQAGILSAVTIAATIAQQVTNNTLGTFALAGEADNDTLLAMTFAQLPIHKAILLGADALAKLEVTGEGNVKMYAKPKGSAGVLDPIDQRQSIGFKLNTIGFKLIRDESCHVFYHVPSQAITTAGISL